MPLGYNGFTQETENAAALTLGRNGFVQPVAGPGGAETVTSLTVTGLTASRLVATDGTKTLASVANLASWVAGTTNQVTVTDDGDGTITLSLATNLYSDGANIAAFKSGANPQEARVYGNTTGPLYGSIKTSLSVVQFNAYGTDCSLAVNDTTYWKVLFAGAAFVPSADNSFDVGSATFRPRDVYAGRQFLGADGSSSSPGWSFSAASGWGVHRDGGAGLVFDVAGAPYVAIATDGVTVAASGKYSWSSGSIGAAQDLILSRVSAGIGKVTNGASACEWRVHGDATKYVTVQHTGTQANILASADGLAIGTSTAANVAFLTGGTTKWLVQSDGMLLANADNTYDIGASGATRPRTGYFGTSVSVGTTPAGSGHVRLPDSGSVMWVAGASTVGIRAVSGVFDFSAGSAYPGGINLYVGSAAGIAITSSLITVSDTWNFAFNATNGTKIGTATTQKIGLWNATPVVQQVGGVTLTNNVTAGGTTNQLDDFTSLTVYATDAAAIRNNIYQLGRKVKLLTDALRTIGGLQNADA